MKVEGVVRVLCPLICFTVTVYGLCTLQNELSRVEASGFKSYLVHTNKCLEITGSVISPEVIIGFNDYGVFKKHYADDCCCQVTSYSEQELRMERPDGVGHVTARYKRIEDCGCISCN